MKGIFHIMPNLRRLSDQRQTSASISRVSPHNVCKRLTHCGNLLRIICSPVVFEQKTRNPRDRARGSYGGEGRGGEGRKTVRSGGDRRQQGTASSRHSRTNTHMNSQRQCQHARGRHSSQCWEKQTWTLIPNSEAILLITTHKGKVSFLQWRLTGCTNHTLGQTSRPAEDDQQEMNLMAFAWEFSFRFFFLCFWLCQSFACISCFLILHFYDFSFPLCF